MAPTDTARVRSAIGGKAGGGRRRAIIAGALVATALVAGWARPAPSQAAGCGLLSILVPGCPGPEPTPPPPSPPAPLPPLPDPVVVPPPLPGLPVNVNFPAGAQRLLDLVNEERAGARVGPLAMRADVVAIAVGHSVTMATQGHIFHNDGFFLPEVRSRLGASTMGENVAMNDSIDDAHARLMASPHHRDNIVDPRFTSVGIAAVPGAGGAFFVTEDFIQARGSAAPRPEPRAAGARPTPKAPTVHVAAAPAPPAPPAAGPPPVDVVVAPGPPPPGGRDLASRPGPVPAPPATPSRELDAAAALLLLAAAAGSVRLWWRRPSA